jgi:hypothetical protein
MLIRYLFELFTKNDLPRWYTSLSIPDRRELLNCPIYEYVEVMP